MAITEVRRISRDLRPSALDDLGLSPALESLASEFSKRTGIKVEINTVAFRNMLPDGRQNHPVSGGTRSLDQY